MLPILALKLMIVLLFDMQVVCLAEKKSAVNRNLSDLCMF